MNDRQGQTGTEMVDKVVVGRDRWRTGTGTVRGERDFGGLVLCGMCHFNGVPSFVKKRRFGAWPTWDVAVQVDGVRWRHANNINVMPHFT